MKEPATPSFHALRFGRAAAGYEDAAHIQARMADKLSALGGLGDSGAPFRILEFGCGTGLLTRRLRQRFPAAALLATDASAAMLTQARQNASVLPSPLLAFVLQDASGARPPTPEVQRQAPVDLAASNALVQWLPDLSRHLDWVAGLCAPHGHYLVSGFSRDNFNELNSCLSRPPFSYREFPGHDPEEVRRAATEAGWQVASFEAWEEIEIVASPLAALRRIQRLGSTRDPHTGGRLTRRNLKSLLADYADRFSAPGGVSLTWRPWVAHLQRG